MALIFDTETTGLPVCPCYGVFHDYTKLKYYNSSRVIQVSYILTNDLFQKVEESDVVIKRDNFSIDNSQFHGITNEISDTTGISFILFAEMFSNALDDVDIVIAHNIGFDLNVLRSELYRYQLFDVITKLDSKKIVCSMKLTKNLVKATFKSGIGIKDPNLKELYFYATGKVMENHHNSLYDTINLFNALKIIYGNLILII
jgi:DNA polymerase-3 subunit alpha